MRKPTTRNLAETYHTTTRTVRNWRKAGAPLNDPAAMQAWLAGRRTAPAPGPATKAPPSKATGPAPPAAGKTGAPEALRRLELSEVQAFGRLQAALERGTALEVRDARRGYLETAEALRKADLAVSEARRDAKESVPRSEVAGMLKGLAWSLRIALAQTAEALARRANPSDPLLASEALRKAFDGFLVATLSTLRQTLDGSGLAWPPWAFEALASDAAGAFTDGGKLAERERFLSAVFRATAGDMGEFNAILAGLTVNEP